MNDPLNLLLQPLLLPFTLMNSVLSSFSENNQIGGLHLPLGQGPYGLGEAASLQENIFVPQQEIQRVPLSNPNSNIDAKPATSPYVAVIPTPAFSRNRKQNAAENFNKVAAFGGARNQRIRFNPNANLVVDRKKASVFGTDKHTK